MTEGLDNFTYNNFFLRLCKEKQVDYCEIAQLPGSGRQIHVYGERATEIQPEVDKFIKANKDSNGFQVHAHDTSDYFWFHEYGGSSKKPRFSPSFRIFKMEYVDQKLIKTDHTACELIMMGRKKDSRSGLDALYVVFPAHLVLQDRDCKRMLSNQDRDVTIRSLKQNLLAQVQTMSYIRTTGMSF